jgi:exonuclease III
MIDQKCSLLNWNVRGLNNSARRKVVKDLVSDLGCSIVALQETKLAVIHAEDVRETVGTNFMNSFVYLPAQGTRGGVMVAVDEDHYSIKQFEHRSYSVSALLESTHCAESWWVTVVYGPLGDQEKLDFLQELKFISTVVSDKWLVIGDFNMILQACDKSNNNLNRRLMGAFRGLVNEL